MKRRKVRPEYRNEYITSREGRGEEEEEEEEEANRGSDRSHSKIRTEENEYYFAVIECDSTKTAEAIYREDSAEFQNSSNVLELSYVPMK